MSAPASTRGRSARAMDERFRRRRREVRRRAARRRRRLLIAVVSLVALLAAGAAVARSPLFAITEVRVIGIADEQAAAVRAASDLDVGENLLGADLTAAASRVAALSWVRTAEIARLPPSAVEVRVVPRVPLAVVHVAGGAWILDGDGVVLEGGEDDTLVAIEAPEAVLPGPGARASDAAVRNALAVHQALPPDLRERVERYDADPSERGLRLLLRDQGGVWVRFGSVEQASEKAQVIELLLEQAAEQLDRREDGEPPESGEVGDDAEPASLAGYELDVRAPDNPVLVPDAPPEAPTDELDSGADPVP